MKGMRRGWWTRNYYPICSGLTVFARSDSAATHRTILCGFYSRAATNQERRLFNSVFSVKSFVIVRALRKASFIRLTNLRCGDLICKPSSLISPRFATKRYLHRTSNLFPRRLPMNSHDDRPPCLKNCRTSLDSVSSCTCRVYSCHSR